MADEADIANEYAANEIERALLNRQKQAEQEAIEAATLAPDRDCRDCGEDMTKRLAVVPTAVRCVICQGIYEDKI